MGRSAAVSGPFALATSVGPTGEAARVAATAVATA